jgi:hypothetical protein
VSIGPARHCSSDSLWASLNVFPNLGCHEQVKICRSAAAMTRQRLAFVVRSRKTTPSRP